jgi:hypothetical protein
MIPGGRASAWATIQATLDKARFGRAAPGSPARRVSICALARARPVGVEVFQHTPILRDVVILPTEAQLIVGHLAVEQVPAMTLVNDHQIILVDGRRFGVVVSRAS